MPPRPKPEPVASNLPPRAQMIAQLKSIHKRIQRIQAPTASAYSPSLLTLVGLHLGCSEHQASEYLKEQRALPLSVYQQVFRTQSYFTTLDLEAILSGKALQEPEVAELVSSQLAKHIEFNQPEQTCALLKTANPSLILA